jgi:hypothetical protein
MGRKGVSIRKPKTKSKPVSNAETNSSSKKRSGDSSSVQSLVKNTGATLTRGGTNPAAGSNNKNRKGKSGSG